jgi:hypothetical protein
MSKKTRWSSLDDLPPGRSVFSVFELPTHSYSDAACLNPQQVSDHGGSIPGFITVNHSTSLYTSETQLNNEHIEPWDRVKQKDSADLQSKNKVTIGGMLHRCMVKGRLATEGPKLKSTPEFKKDGWKKRNSIQRICLYRLLLGFEIDIELNVLWVLWFFLSSHVFIHFLMSLMLIRSFVLFHQLV